MRCILDDFDCLFAKQVYQILQFVWSDESSLSCHSINETVSD